MTPDCICAAWHRTHEGKTGSILLKTRTDGLRTNEAVNEQVRSEIRAALFAEFPGLGGIQ